MAVIGAPNDPIYLGLSTKTTKGKGKREKGKIIVNLPSPT